jgi:hypothetical protein
MGADNWIKYPKCQKEKEDQLSILEQKLPEYYGKVSIDEYGEMEKQISKLKAEINSEHYESQAFREDYELGVRGSIFEVSYSGACQKCGFKFRYKFEQSVFDA